MADATSWQSESRISTSNAGEMGYNSLSQTANYKFLNEYCKIKAEKHGRE